MDSTKKSSDLTIGETSYSVLERPSVKSQLVEEAQADVTITIDLNDMPGDLLLVAKFLQVAENGLVSFPVIQGKVKKSQIQILKLTDKSQVAISDFARASSRVIDNLESTHYYLYNGNIKMATKMYTSIAKEAEEMAETARTLSDKYQKEVEKLEGILNETYEKKEAKMKEKTDSEAEKGELTSSIKKLEALKKEAHEKFMKMESLFNEAKRRERKALKKDGNLFKKLVNVVASKFVGPGTEIFDTGPKKDAANAFRAAKFKYFEEMEKVRDAKSALIADIAEFTQRMSNIEDVQKLADEAIESLQSVISGLTSVVAEFTKIATFWDEMSGHLKDLQKEEQLKNALSLKDEKERKEIINSYVFKKALLKNFAKWIATHQMTKIFRQRMKPVRDELANIVRGNLNEEESRKNMKKISGELFAEEARRRKRIKEMKRDEL